MFVESIGSVKSIQGRGCLNEHFKLSHIHIAMWLILGKIILAVGLNIGIKEFFLPQLNIQSQNH